jgi:DNA polymerase III subunit gamma/tau
MTNVTPYRVLARKYRPQKLSELVGQEILVTTLCQGIAQHRLPHAFILHGIRGVGKTTTARILAKALNCVGPDGQGSPTADPCGICPSCVAITDERHIDVIEMDAASRTGVDDIREVIEAARYKAVNGRFKIYIIDEVHMLSKSAFNALLKTLEEPPPHVKFIFATTELKKIPDTVLSRCMRFDLSRIAPELLFNHFKNIAALENVRIDDESLALLVRAADGSARDGLSLLDQAIALTNGQVTANVVRNMLGLVDRGQLFALFEQLMRGQVATGITAARDFVHRGSDATVVIEELLDLAYWIATLKTCPSLGQDITWPESDRKQGIELANQLPLPSLMQAWQVLSKGYEEVSRSPLPNQAMEMVLIRLCYLSALPSAEELLSALQNKPITASHSFQNQSPVAAPITIPSTLQQTVATASPSAIHPQTFEDLVQLVAQSREAMMHAHLVHDVQLIDYTVGKLTLQISDHAPKTFVSDLSKLLQRLTHTPWQVIISQQQTTNPTLAEQQKQHQQQLREQSLNHPIIKQLTEAFPGSTVTVKS